MLRPSDRDSGKPGSHAPTPTLPQHAWRSLSPVDIRAHYPRTVRVKDQVEQLLTKIAEVIGGADQIKGRRVAPDQRGELLAVTRDLKRALDAAVYPHPLPPSVFDPSDTRLFGRFAAIALVAQDRIPLGAVEPVYGSGVYALYYKGGNPEYQLIAGTESPVYIGKAQPREAAVHVMEQGTAITDRLGQHAKSIRNADGIELDDFECRYLVITAGWETPAELELMRFFKPLWNTGIGPVHGIGKHGDLAVTRGNKCSPWDTLHPGRQWATDTFSDQKTAAQIRAEIATHLQMYPPVQKRQDVIDAYVSMLAKPIL